MANAPTHTNAVGATGIRSKVRGGARWFSTLGSVTLGANDAAVPSIEILALADVRRRSFLIKSVQVTEQRQCSHPAVEKPRVRFSELVASKHA